MLQLELPLEGLKRALSENEKQLVDNFFLLAERFLSTIELQLGLIEKPPQPHQRAARYELLRRWAYKPIPTGAVEDTDISAFIATHAAKLVVELAYEAFRLLSSTGQVAEIAVLATLPYDEDDVPEELFEQRLLAIKNIAKGFSREQYIAEVLEAVERIRGREAPAADNVDYERGWSYACDAFQEALTVK